MIDYDRPDSRRLPIIKYEQDIERGSESSLANKKDALMPRKRFRLQHERLVKGLGRFPMTNRTVLPSEEMSLKRNISKL